MADHTISTIKNKSSWETCPRITSLTLSGRKQLLSQASPVTTYSNMFSCLFWGAGLKVINSSFCPCIKPNCKLNNEWSMHSKIMPNSGEEVFRFQVKHKMNMVKSELGFYHGKAMRKISMYHLTFKYHLTFILYTC